MNRDYVSQEYSDVRQELGYVPADKETSAEARRLLNSQDLESKAKGRGSKTKSEFWAAIGWIALPRFPELQKGEHISDREITRVLKALEAEGYHVDRNYRIMSTNDRYHYLMNEIRPVVWKRVRKHCPKAAWEIERHNLFRKKEELS